MSQNPLAMYAPERQQIIIDHARDKGRVEVGALAEMLRVTPETVRRDLTALERRGLLRRVHGGALPVDRLGVEPSLERRMTRAHEEKMRIAARALEELPDGGTILLDSGSTTVALAQALPADSDLTVVTNSVAIASLLYERADTSLVILGGPVRRRTGAAVGSWGRAALEDIYVDVAFLGANGLDVERGFTTPHGIEADTKRSFIRAARRAVVVADSSKAGVVSFHRFARTDEVDLLITDARLDDETAEQFDGAGVDVARV
ncbi:DeoR/GlpR family DNA-binding transcription regulator [Serinibacter salmoneus]|uniref:Lactose phosphotransferase system repressor n=1 Tax=Serinibacter salmoneus TaxID=556530 RepID=A0A2A9CXT4_9MICO|nr:DeoR/GlpR family DNA-binding transcription regulator [Serinibacter salmoneus]PFG19248.1 DeoR family transcriptional regulator [Serinibacter salmoneus]